MDETVRPHDADADEGLPLPEARVELPDDPFGASRDVPAQPPGQPVDASGLPGDPPSDDASVPAAGGGEPAVESDEPIATPHPTLFDTADPDDAPSRFDGASAVETREADTDPAYADEDAGSPEPEPEPQPEPQPDVFVAEAAVVTAAEPVPVEEELSELSLDEMVTELADDEVPLVPDATVTETGPEIETIEGVEGEEIPSAEYRGSWRDEESEAVVPVLARRKLSARLPFWLYGLTWIAFVGVMTYLMWPISRAPFVGQTYYAYFILGGAALLAIGPVIAVAVWLAARMGASKVERAGLVRAIAFRAAGWMALGVTMMWVSLYVLDLHRLGRIG